MTLKYFSLHGILFDVKNSDKMQWVCPCTVSQLLGNTIFSSKVINLNALIVRVAFSVYLVYPGKSLQTGHRRPRPSNYFDCVSCQATIVTMPSVKLTRAPVGLGIQPSLVKNAL